jgi:hypothetical protein
MTWVLCGLDQCVLVMMSGSRYIIELKVGGRLRTKCSSSNKYEASEDSTPSYEMIDTLVKRGCLESWLFGCLDIMHYSNKKGSLVYQQRHFCLSLNHSPFHEPTFILSLSIFSHYPSLSKHSPSPIWYPSSNKMYIIKLGQYFPARKSAFGTSVPPNESKTLGR